MERRYKVRISRGMCLYTLIALASPVICKHLRRVQSSRILSLYQLGSGYIRSCLWRKQSIIINHSSRPTNRQQHDYDSNYWNHRIGGRVTKQTTLPQILWKDLFILFGSNFWKIAKMKFPWPYENSAYSSLKCLKDGCSESPWPVLVPNWFMHNNLLHYWIVKGWRHDLSWESCSTLQIFQQLGFPTLQGF